ncbi:hypothetical protein POJ06DRAFT_251024 [Lipomyces tetrasporus]|uniref:Uncharacterized protein n=1 Tax=Lipomyces tetrasporus TaxID=54092 RepID=A0AAD7QUL4_9ASCO|nr:uncharacterized protein POJ06DRAFT_251024 [Lipomyces tetrasporus]KAJ8101271.1 hypothetical protein POJ06DRAFT_251024 [Lipomyces tetrasporus]
MFKFLNRITVTLVSFVKLIFCCFVWSLFNLVGRVSLALYQWTKQALFRVHARHGSTAQNTHKHRLPSAGTILQAIMLHICTTEN